MEKISLTFLGTSNAIPTAKRSHSSILLKYKNENILVDCGEGTQRQFKIASLSPTKLTKILITHWHGDHILGLPGLFQTLKMSNYNKTLHLYGPKGSKSAINIIDKIARIKIKLKVHEISNKTLDFQEFQILSSPMKHQTPCNAYAFKIKDKIRLDKSKLKKLKLPNHKLLKSLAQGKSIRFKNKTISPKQVSKIEKGRKITFILDTKMNPNTISLSKNSNLIISEATFSNSERSLASSHEHLTAEQAATIASRSHSKKLYLTHISQRYEHNPKHLLAEAKAIFKNSHLAEDLQTIEI